MNISFVAFLNKRGIASRRPIDLAIITKNNGYTWSDLKSWGHHVDTGGRYGKLGELFLI